MVRRYVAETFEIGGSTGTLLMPDQGYNDKIIVFCYGGSLMFSRYKTIPFLELFVDAGWGAVIFDYYGMGVGWLDEEIEEETGLFTRVADVKMVIGYVRESYHPKKLVVMGHSMGCPVAVHAVASRQDVDDLILSAPAAYAREVMEQHITFANWGPYLTEGLWQNSDVFDVLRNMSIPCHIIRYRGDTIVNTASGDIPATYFSRAARKGLQISTIDSGHGGHSLFGDFPDTLAKQQKVAGMVLEWLEGEEWDCTEEATVVQEICRLVE